MIEFKKSPSDAYRTLPKKTVHKLGLISNEINAKLLSIKKNFFEIGKLLSQAKEILPHGTFQIWIEDKFKGDLKYPTAYLYKTIYETFRDYPETARLLGVSFLMQMTQSSFPQEIMDIITANPELVIKADLSTLKEAYQQYKKEEITLEEFTLITKSQIVEASKVKSRESVVRISKEIKLSAKVGLIGVHSAIKKVSGRILRMNIHLDPCKDDELVKQTKYAIHELERILYILEHGLGLFKYNYDEKKGEYVKDSKGFYELVPNDN